MSDADDKKPPALGGTWKDTAGALAKGGIGAIPIVGSLLAEVAGLVIPNQRLNRIEAYLRLLGERLDTADADILKQRFDDPETVDLFEEGAAQSVRAISEERKAYIATLVANGFNGDGKARIEAKRLLNLIKEIDDDQMIILSSYLHKNLHDDEFHERHNAVLGPVSAHLGSTQEELDAATLYDLARAQLQRLELLKPNFPRLRKGEVPEFDPDTGTVKANSTDVTPLGRLLLSRIGLAEPGEF